jgi:hypothetical protein
MELILCTSCQDYIKTNNGLKTTKKLSYIEIPLGLYSTFNNEMNVITLVALLVLSLGLHIGPLSNRPLSVSKHSQYFVGDDSKHRLLRFIFRYKVTFVSYLRQSVY